MSCWLIKVCQQKTRCTLYINTLIKMVNVRVSMSCYQKGRMEYYKALMCIEKKVKDYLTILGRRLSIKVVCVYI